MNTAYTKRLFPASTHVDYTDKDEICGYQLLLCKVYESEGGLRYPAVCNSTTREVERQGIVWLREVKAAIKDIFLRPLAESGNGRSLTLGDLPDLLSSYDLFYRICNGKADSDFVRKVRLMTVDRWLKGDKSISKTAVVIELMREVNRDIRELDDRYSTYAIATVDDWIKELMHYGKFQGTTLEETYQRLSFLIYDNLFAYLGRKDQAAAKTRWIERFTLSDSEIDALDTPTLRAYIAFTQSAAVAAGHPLDYIDSIYEHLFAKLSSRSDLHPLHCQAIDLDLASRHHLSSCG